MSAHSILECRATGATWTATDTGPFSGSKALARKVDLASTAEVVVLIDD